ncbi:MAG: outer membrane beta-barrel protein [Pseudomonadota bacterium]
MPEGFFTGPYIQLQLGVMQFDDDRDQQTGIRLGRNYEPSFGLIFGWNILDELALEFDGRYSTNINSGRSEHIAAPGFSVKYNFYQFNVFNPETFILPYIKGGMNFRVAVLPGNDLSSDKKITQFGYGPSFGAGVDFLINKYVFLGIIVRYDILNYEDVRQNLDNAAPPVIGALIYRGGWHNSLGAGITLGVHY